MSSNADKCKVMHIGHNNAEYVYKLNDVEITATEAEKYHGVWTSNDLKSGLHCSNAAKKANQVLGLIKRTIAQKSKDIILPLYKSLIRPHLDYCVPVWRPHLKKDITLLENVQRRATKLIAGLEKLDYMERLKRLRLTTLETRFLRADMLETFKIFKGFDRLDPKEFFCINTRVSRSHNFKLFKNHSALDIRKYSFSQRVVNEWNRLPSHIVNIESINAFKNGLDLYFKNVRGFR